MRRIAMMVLRLVLKAPYFLFRIWWCGKSDKISRIETMMSREQYADEDSQAVLQTYLDSAKKEADYADDNLKKTYKQYITNFDNYLEKVSLAEANVGSMQKRLALTKNRMENQQTTVEELKSNNEDRDISDIIIEYSNSSILLCSF